MAATTRVLHHDLLVLQVPDGPGMVIFSAGDGQYAYVCSSFTAETVVVEVAARRVIASVAQPSAFCPNIATSPDGSQVKQEGRLASLFCSASWILTWC
jgi:sugar lactone lactonase YvrE